MNNLFNDYAFGIILTLGVFIFSLKLKKRFNYSIVNPVFISLIIIIILLYLFDIDYETYNKGGQFINMFLGPATVVLAVPLYRQFKILKKNFVAIIPGILVGSIVSIVSVFFTSKFFNFEDTIIKSLLAKSVTTPIGIAVTEQLEGVSAISVFSIVITGITGALIAPMVCKILNIDNGIARGVGIGTSSHALGTSKALEMGEVEGAMSSLSIGISGIITVIIANPLYYILTEIMSNSVQK